LQEIFPVDECLARASQLADHLADLHLVVSTPLTTADLMPLLPSSAEVATTYGPRTSGVPVTIGGTALPSTTLAAYT